MTTSLTKEESAALRELADELFASITAPHLNIQSLTLPFDSTQWELTAQAGLTLLTTPEDAGGSGASLAEAAIVVEESGYHALPGPLADNDVLAAWVLREIGVQIDAGPMAVASATQLSGATLSIDAVPWADSVDRLLIVGPDAVAVVPRGAIETTPVHELAGEGRKHVTVALSDATIVPTADDMRPEFRMRGALVRSWQICGATRRCLDLAIAHVADRVQFGRPLAKFQAVQLLLAQSAGAVTMASTAAAMATTHADRDGFDCPASQMSVAAAKIQACRAAETVSRATHQAHGAIGFTLDHQLRHFSGRALAWSRDFGTARAWEQTLGRIVMSSPDPLWSQITRL